VIRPERLTRLAAITTLTFICLSVAIVVGVGAAGPSAATVRVYRAGAWPPWFASLRLSDLTVTAAPVSRRDWPRSGEAGARRRAG
jgi:hypothetical protein